METQDSRGTKTYNTPLMMLLPYQELAIVILVSVLTLPSYLLLINLGFMYVSLRLI